MAIRWPAHPFAQALIRACGFPLAAPSANRSNQVSPTNAEHVQRAIGDKIRLIVDGGQSQIGIESTVLDLSGNVPRILRPGAIAREQIESILGAIEFGPMVSEVTLPAVAPDDQAQTYPSESESRPTGR